MKYLVICTLFLANALALADSESLTCRGNKNGSPVFMLKVPLPLNKKILIGQIDEQRVYLSALKQQGEFGIEVFNPIEPSRRYAEGFLANASLTYASWDREQLIEISCQN